VRVSAKGEWERRYEGMRVGTRASARIHVKDSMREYMGQNHNSDISFFIVFIFDFILAGQQTRSVNNFEIV